MPASSKYLADEMLILVTNSGELSYADYQRTTAEVLALMQAHDTWRCLIDNRELDNRASAADIFNLPRLYSEMGIPRTLRAAILIGAATPKREDHEFYETVCLNSGYSFRLFGDYDEAMAWLKE